MCPDKVHKILERGLVSVAVYAQEYPHSHGDKRLRDLSCSSPALGEDGLEEKQRLVAGPKLVGHVLRVPNCQYVVHKGISAFTVSEELCEPGSKGVSCLLGA